MHNSNRQTFRSLALVLGILCGVSFGQVALADAENQAVPAPTSEAVVKPLMTGQEVYQNVCIACHAPPGLGGAPALGNAEAWSGRIAHGMDTLISHVLNGYSGSVGIMPRKGGRADLSDEEIIGAVEYMVEQIDR